MTVIEKIRERQKSIKEAAANLSIEQMAEEVLEDDRTATAYTLDELIKLIELSPSKEFLKKIHDTKTVFEDSKIIKTINKKNTNYD